MSTCPASRDKLQRQQAKLYQKPNRYNLVRDVAANACAVPYLPLALPTNPETRHERKLQTMGRLPDGNTASLTYELCPGNAHNAGIDRYALFIEREMERKFRRDRNTATLG